VPERSSRRLQRYGYFFRMVLRDRLGSGRDGRSIAGASSITNIPQRTSSRRLYTTTHSRAELSGAEEALTKDAITDGINCRMDGIVGLWSILLINSILG
jgi:hypothetical protein